ncbi:MAG: phosphoenolpyruvate-utilizing N-terminal domain-containing protein, partial [Verrucomicrobiales bacterium]|nr:phosphoenolpyruvate-utilizing N-terminal domain-containing protein [Verrucomicrobiales bacterium]
MAERLHEGELIFRGIPASAGVCRGNILVLDRPRHDIQRRELADGEVARELDRFEEALAQTRLQLLDVQRKVIE